MHPETPHVREAARQMVRELHLLNGRVGVGDFSVSGCHLLTELDALGQATASELAERLVLEKSTLSRLVHTLRKQGYLLAQTNPTDARQKLLSLSKKGCKAAQDIHRHARAQVDSALDHVSEQDRATLVEGMQRYAKALRYARLARDYRIRPIGKRDNPAVARIIRDVMTEFGAVGEGYSINDPEVDDMFTAYASGRAVFHVITRGKQVLGCGGIGPLEGADPSVCELRKMYFLPEVRGTGMGTRLLRICLNDAVRLGYETCYLETLEHMTQARHLYRKFGFQSIDKPLGNTGHSGCNHWMVKKLGKD